jgi:D-amino peptidase
MRVFVSVDMEGVAGIVDWEQCRAPGTAYEEGRRLLVAEVNAAIDGALAGGATDILVNDAHSVMRNLPPGELHGRASYLAGSHKPLYMMEGLDDSFGAVLYVGYHGSMGSAGVLSHTYNPRAVHEVRIGGTVAGESGLNALVAAAYGVPVVLVTGDQTVGPEAAPFCPDIEAVQVKRAVSRFAAESLHPDRACELVREGAERAVAKAADTEAPSFGDEVVVEVDWRTADQATMAAWVGGSVEGRTTTITGRDPLAVYRTFVTQVLLTRGIAE